MLPDLWSHNHLPKVKIKEQKTKNEAPWRRNACLTYLSRFFLNVCVYMCVCVRLCVFVCVCAEQRKKSKERVTVGEFSWMGYVIRPGS